MKLDPSIFKRAATSVLRGMQEFCCCAIEWQTKDSRYLKLFEDNFKPENRGTLSPWWTMSDNPEMTFRQLHEARIIALLLCAEIARSQR